MADVLHIHRAKRKYNPGHITLVWSVGKLHHLPDQVKKAAFQVLHSAHHLKD